MQPGFYLTRELANVHKPKYSVRRVGVTKYKKCPCCNGFNVLERTGQIKSDDAGNGIHWTAAYGRWYTCGDCNKNFFESEIVNVNHKKLTEEDKTNIVAACIAQDSLSKIYDILRRNDHGLSGIGCDKLAHLYAKWLPEDPLATDVHGEL